MRQLAVVLAVTGLLSGCAGMEVKRAAQQADDKEAYLASLQGAPEFQGTSDCNVSGAVGGWTRLEFTAATPVRRLPNGVRAAAFCVAVPAGAHVLEFATDSRGGMTYQQAFVVLPSLLFLDSTYEILLDEPAPDANYNSRMVTSGLDGYVPLSEGLRDARHVVLYVHPQFLDTGVRIHGGQWQTRVPFNPYGVVRVRFHERP